MSTHYSLAHKPAQLRDSAELWAAELVKKCRARSNKTKKIPILCYSGMSGVSAATALSIALATRYPKFKFRMAYVRKKHETSHGVTVEHDLEHHSNDDWETTFLVFVDDFISSGGSRAYVVDKMYEVFWNRFDPDTRPASRSVPTISVNYEPADETEWWKD